MKVEEIMHVVTKLPYDTSVTEAANVMDQKVIGSILVEENGKVIGIVTERDILRKIVAKRQNADKLTIKEIMNAPLITVEADTDIYDASKIIANNNIRRLIITEKDKIVGIVTASNIAKNLRYVIGKKVVSISGSKHFRPNYEKP
ncbi:MAG: CBS domain-containing protein [Candidatus Firestonebacteria bacterium]|nr:CBS domain-containing protein [Candidatus Firestonebacteria bacterium]